MTVRLSAIGLMMSLLLFSSTSWADDLTLQARNGAPYPELTPEQLVAFLEGKADYSRPLSPADGLGPVFNKSNCGSCHGAGTIIGGHGTIQVTLFGADDKGSFVPLDDLGGPIFQLNAPLRLLIQKTL